MLFSWAASNHSFGWFDMQGMAAAKLIQLPLLPMVPLAAFTQLMFLSRVYRLKERAEHENHGGQHKM